MNRFRIIVVEFHSLVELLSPNSMKYSLICETFDKVLRTHECVHIHPNNYWGSVKYEDIEIPKMMEFTFLRRDRISKKTFCSEFPHPLDSDNTENETVVLPRCWFSDPNGRAS